MSLEEPADRSTSVATVSLKLPSFWPADPEVWFAQVEAQFATRGISAQKTKYEYVFASLSAEFAVEVRDLIPKPPKTDQYNKLKEQLIKCTAASEQRRLQQLFNAEELGDRKPTQLLQCMQQLLGEKASTTDGSFLQELFLRRLPSNVCMVLASTADTTSLDKLASLADKIMEVATPTSSVSVVSQSQLTSEMEQLRTQISDLHKLVQQLSISQQRNPSCTRSPSPAPNRSQSDLCWYHQKFGNGAKKCHQPCSKSGNALASSH